jgi:SpoVK/Ycf46/Vps4 family AAA+-type ATPase
MTAFKYAKLSNNPELINLFEDAADESTSEVNSSISDNFESLMGKILKVSNQFSTHISGFEEEQRMEIKSDLVKIFLLLKDVDDLSIYDGFAFGTSIVVLHFPDRYNEILDNIKQLSEPEKISFSKEILSSERESFNSAIITKENFSLDFPDNLTQNEISKLKKSFYDYAVIMANCNGIPEDDESLSLKFLSKTFFKEQKEDAKPKEAKDLSKNDLDSILEELNSLVGLENIKNDIHSLVNIIKVNKLRKKEGLAEQKLSLHSVFIGPPGTGKTTIARILSKIYYSLDILPEINFVETDRSGLVAGYVGQTAIKTDNIISQAKNGILFIDEAYTLKRNDSDNDYGQEAIDILLKRMEDYRENLIIIVAGYEKEMNHFINSNPGLKSRFNRYFHFMDYDPIQLTEIFKRISENSGFVINESILCRVKELFEILYSQKDLQFGNARLARNIFEKTFERQANRTALISNLTKEQLTTIEYDDIPFNEFLNANTN